MNWLKYSLLQINRREILTLSEILARSIYFFESQFPYLQVEVTEPDNVKGPLVLKDYDSNIQMHSFNIQHTLGLKVGNFFLR